MNLQERLFWLSKIAQVEQPGVQSISGSPTNVDINNCIIGWGAENLTYISNIVNQLNWAIYIISGGQLSFYELKTNLFISDNTNIVDRVLLAIVKFSKLVYENLLTPNGNNSKFAEKLNQAEKTKRIEFLKNSLNTTANIPDGGINTLLQSKVGGSLKQNLLNLLNLIK